MTVVASMRASAELSSVSTLLDRRAAEQATLPFLVAVDGSASIDYRSARKRAADVAARLKAAGAQRGESVAFAMHNSTDCALVVLGILYGGFRAVAINLVAGDDAMAYALGHSRTRRVIVDVESRELIERVAASASYREHAARDADLPLLDGRWLASPSAQADDPSAVLPDDPGSEPSGSRESGTDDGDANANTDGLIMYTSGTTGRPKGVVLSQGNLLAGGRNVAIGHALEPRDRALCVLPLFHINGLCVTLFGPLVSAGSVVIPPRFSTTRFWEWVAAHRCTWFSVVPTQVSYLLHDVSRPSPTPALRFARSASAPLAPDVHTAFEERFDVPLIETMGLTETSAQILSNPMPPAKRRSGSPGRAVGTEVRIVDVVTSVDCPAEVDGEILVRGSNVMQRYFRNPSATADALSDAGWLRTGDIGRRDADGFVYVTGRLKELIIKGGENIAPREIDEALHAHPDVIEAAAFGRPCKRYGENVEAAVAVAPGSVVDEQTLRELCEQRLGAFKSPERIHLLGELPKGPSGKIQRRKVAELCVIQARVRRHTGGTQ